MDNLTVTKKFSTITDKTDDIHRVSKSCRDYPKVYTLRLSILQFYISRNINVTSFVKYCVMFVLNTNLLLV